jgi:predicted O-methyltransferase YrrM
MLIRLFKTLRHSLPARYSQFLERRAEEELRRKEVLWNLLQEYRRGSPSTGCLYSDYMLLYNYVREKKPVEVLECGTGLSTVVIAYALKENEAEFDIAGRVTSMEESQAYYNAALPLIPEELKKYVDLVLSPLTEGRYHYFRGMKYANLPDRPYDFVFIDGPDQSCDPRENDDVLFDFDFIDVVRKSQKPVGALIDTRTHICFVYSILFGDKFRYDYVRKVGIIEPVTKRDLATVAQFTARAMKKRAFRRPPMGPFLRGQYYYPHQR